MPLSTSRLALCEYHPLAQRTVYHHVQCFYESEWRAEQDLPMVLSERVDHYQ